MITASCTFKGCQQNRQLRLVAVVVLWVAVQVRKRLEPHKVHKLKLQEAQDYGLNSNNRRKANTEVTTITLVFIITSNTNNSKLYLYSTFEKQSYKVPYNNNKLQIKQKIIKTNKIIRSHTLV